MGRVQLGFFVAACLLVCRTGTAQIESAGGPVAPGYHPYTVADPNLMQAGWQYGYAGNTPSPSPAHSGADPRTLYHLLPEDRHFIYDHDSRLDLTIRETVRGSWFRLEYLNWKISSPENVFLGAPSALQTNRLDITTGTLVASPNNPPLNPFDISFFDPLNPLPQIGRAQIPTTGTLIGTTSTGSKGALEFRSRSNCGLKEVPGCSLRRPTI